MYLYTIIIKHVLIIFIKFLVNNIIEDKKLDYVINVH